MLDNSVYLNEIIDLCEKEQYLAALCRIEVARNFNNKSEITTLLNKLTRISMIHLELYADIKEMLLKDNLYKKSLSDSYLLLEVMLVLKDYQGVKSYYSHFLESNIYRMVSDAEDRWDRDIISIPSLFYKNVTLKSVESYSTLIFSYASIATGDESLPRYHYNTILSLVIPKAYLTPFIPLLYKNRQYDAIKYISEGLFYVKNREITKYLTLAQDKVNITEDLLIESSTFDLILDLDIMN